MKRAFIFGLSSLLLSTIGAIAIGCSFELWKSPTGASLGMLILFFGGAVIGYVWRESKP